MSKENLTELGFEPETSGLMYQRSQKLNYKFPALPNLDFNWHHVVSAFLELVIRNLHRGS